MFNAKRSALYIAIIGLGLAAGEASAACPAGTRAVSTYTAGYKVTTCVKVGSEVVDVTVQPFDGGEGSPAGLPLSNPSVQASVTGADYGTYLGLGEVGFVPASFVKGSFAKTKKPKPPKQPKCYIFVPKDGDDDGDDAHDKVKKVKVPCTDPQPFDPDTQSLLDSEGKVVTVLSSPTVPMRCTGSGEDQECTNDKVVIGATDPTTGESYYCPSPPNPEGSRAINVTAIPPFVLYVNINNGAIEGYFGCYDFDIGGGPNIPGSPYLCEALDNFSTSTGCGTGIFSEEEGTPGYTYCTTGKLPEASIICTDDGGGGA